MLYRIPAAAAVVTALAEAGVVAEPCCTACPAGTEKYYSIPNPGESIPQCGECCLDPHFYKLWKVFEPKLLLGDCATKGFTKYVSTETDGVWPVKVTNDRYVKDGLRSHGFCPDQYHAVYADMHDGDKKDITISGSSITIRPSGNDQKWVVSAVLDRTSCSALIDFNVPGKPSPPPVNLTAALWWSWSTTTKKTVFEFTDPTGKLADKTFPLNRWVELKEPSGLSGAPCPLTSSEVYADMHDGDKKAVDLTSTLLTIKPSGNTETWTVKSEWDSSTCSATVDFRVPGKPNPPPVSLKAEFFYTMSATKVTKSEFEFTDPSGTLAVAGYPLNHWVQLGGAGYPLDGQVGEDQSVV